MRRENLEDPGEEKTAGLRPNPSFFKTRRVKEVENKNVLDPPRGRVENSHSENFLQPALAIQSWQAPRWGQPKAVEKIFHGKSSTAAGFIMI
jgi:hypothetical protein